MLRHAAHRLTSRAAAGSISRRALATNKEVGKPIEETKEDVYPKRMQSESLPAKIRIVMKSFNSQKDNLSGLEPYMRKVGLPESRSLYTVLRSPHIDKKSREQFSMHVKKCFVEKKAETHELAKKFFWLKRLRILGAQYEINISFKTRLDKNDWLPQKCGPAPTVFPSQKGRQVRKRRWLGY
ncbi:small ribosomal subunit protein uS10m isoform X1 [Lolium perenne]|uniref:small ribosomal subunit protein uS10m isoform X1 n=2 Tax=Lolium perenne TaxID=4522 RepID=UPI0021F54038|nr:ribosomal protein S10, mitochondrial-like isoform X1 [Lolium perenne]